MEFFWKMAEVMEFIPWFLEFSPTVVDNLKAILAIAFTMGTMCVIALSLVCYIMFELDSLCGFDSVKVMENMGKIWGKSWKSHGIHEQNPCFDIPHKY